MRLTPDPTETMQHDPALPAEAWPLVVDLLDRSGEAWPPALAAWDLAILRAQADRARRPGPGRDTLKARWRMTEHQVRALLSGGMPGARTPPGAVYFVRAGDVVKIGYSRTPNVTARIATLQTGTHLPLELLGTRPGSLGDERLTHQRHAADHVRGEWFRASPAVLAEAASGTTVEPMEAAPTRRADRRAPPVVLANVASHGPPAVLATITGGDTGERRERSGNRHPIRSPDPSLLTTNSTLTDPDPILEVWGPDGEGMTPEACRFMGTYTRWAKDPRAPKRWRTPPAEALAWFLTEIMAKPEVIDGINVLGTLTRWADWLTVKAEAAGKPGTATGAKFPDNWKNALRNWFHNAKAYRAPAPPQGRRGAYGGAPTTPPLFTTPTTPTGDPDDFANWPDDRH